MTFIRNFRDLATSRQKALGGGLFHIIAIVWALIKVNQCTNNDWKSVLFALIAPQLYLLYHYIFKGYLCKDPYYCPEFVPK